MVSQRERVLAARWIIPVSRDPINGGWIRIRGGMIVELGKGTAPIGAEDLGEVAILPGLVNAHTHLEFSDCQHPIGQRGVALSDWIGQVIAARSETTPESKRAAVAAGLNELAASGTSLAGEITTPPCDYPAEPPLPELVTFAEVLGLDPQRSGERLEAATRHMSANRNGAASPHAPYSTSIDTIDACVRLARKYDRPLAMHVAESPAERELLCHGTGPLEESLRALGVWRGELFPWGEDAFVTLIDRLSSAPRVLLIHGNDFGGEEIDCLQSHDNITVVYCPRTHDFFGYDQHPVDRLLAAGVRVALGTDSRASNPDLNLWREIQFLLTNRSDLSPHEVLRMATVNGADALGRADFGRIEVGCRAVFGCVPTVANTLQTVLEDFATHPFTRVP